MMRDISERKIVRRLIHSSISAAIALLCCLTETAYADESGISFWLPGQFGSLAAAPAVPGWSGAAVYYHTTVAASGAAAAAR